VSEPTRAGGRAAGAAAVVLAAVVLAAALLAPPLLVAVLFTGGTPAGATTPAGPVLGVPAPLVDAYARAVARIGQLAPGCRGLRWSMLAAIGQVESGSAAGRRISPGGDVSPPIYGIRLDGRAGTAAVADTDGGRLDGDPQWDRALGPMQFIPGTWTRVGVDASGDGRADPQNVHDAAAATAVFLCGAGRDLAEVAQLRAAIYAYNHSDAYVSRVLELIETFDAAAHPAPAPTGAAAAAIAYALAQRGKPYRWGATGPDAFDCSGLTLRAYEAAGIRLPRVSRDQARAGRHIPPAAGMRALAPGDLVFQATDPANLNTVHHVGIYLGGGQVVHAPYGGTVVDVAQMWSADYAGAVRVTG
jgi:cell wall-associated NlpC family hydrolase